MFRRLQPAQSEPQPPAFKELLRNPPRFPHCDALILHSPGTCSYCDEHPDWQVLRASQGLAFSNTPAQEIWDQRLVPCPSTWSRPASARDQWHGNQADPSHD